jgi:hypothetical protein
VVWFALTSVIASAQVGIPEDPIEGIVKLFDTYRIVMLGEIHDCQQQHELLRKLVATPGFSQRVNDIVMEFGNARYQDAVDRYIGGEDVPMRDVQGAWQDTVGVIGPVGPVYQEFYAAVRRVNKGLPKQQRMRVLLGDPPIDWNKVNSPEDLALFLPFREQFYASVVRHHVLAKKRKALLIIGSGHLRRNVRIAGPGFIESELLSTAVKPYIIMPGSNMVRGYDDLDPRFDQWPAPWLMQLKGSWLGGLPMQTPVGTGLPGTR